MDIAVNERLPRELNFIIHAKAYEFEREGVQRVSAEEIRSYLYDVLWKDKEEIQLCDAVDDIVSLRFSTLYDYLTTKVIKEAKYKNISDFSSLIFNK